MFGIGLGELALIVVIVGVLAGFLVRSNRS
jgi:hypothetical protein